MINTKLILNYTKEFKEGYLENNLIFGSNWDLFWNFSSARRFQLLFYPFTAGKSALLLGDSYSALAGVLIEKGLSVDFLPDFSENEELKDKYAIAKMRFPQLNISQEQKKYSYVVVNIAEQEYTEEYLSYAVGCMDKNSILLICAPGILLNDVKKALFKMGLYKYQLFDPLNNGMLVLECVKGSELIVTDKMDWSSYKSLNDGYYQSPLLNEKWIQRNGFPIFFDKCLDQDHELINDVKKVQVDLLTQLMAVCSKNNIKVYPIYGTLLGLVRDGGYIEGDDDIDVALMREDYDKLMALQPEFSGKYFLQTYANDNCFFGGYAKLRNTQTTAIHPQNWWADCCEGISIDIFPMDCVCADKRKEKQKLRKIRFCQRLLYADSYGTFASFKDMPLLRWKFYKYAGKILGRKRIIDYFEKTLKAGDSSSRLSIYTHYKNGKLTGQDYFSKEFFKNTFEAGYEGVNMAVPAGFDALLKVFYGEGYNNQYAFSESKCRHGFYNISVPYPVYKKRFGGLKHPASIKEPIVLFGDGSVFKACLSYYKSRVNIAKLVLLPGYESVGINLPVITWDEFDKLKWDKSSYRAIICSNDVKYAEELLVEKGFKDYYIFYHVREWMIYANQSQVLKDILSLQ